MPDFDRDDMLRRLLVVSRAGALATLQFYRQAGASLARATKKEGGEIALEADIATSKVMRNAWGLHCSQYPCVDEEEPTTHALLGCRNGTPYGVIDPIDGSQLFEKDMLLPPNAPCAPWGSTVGIMIDGVTKAGVMNQPALRQIYFGVEGGPCRVIRGADYDQWLLGRDVPGTPCVPDSRLDDVDSDHALLLSVPGSSKMSDSGFARWLDVLRKLRDHQLLGNFVAEGCAVGNVAAVLGRKIAAYLNIGGGIDWDLAVPFFLAELQGCTAVTLDGKPIVWNGSKQAVLVAQNRNVADRLVHALG